MSYSTKDLLAEAKNAQQNSHSPYSGFKVGAAVRDTDGRIFSGCNVENAAYPLSQCAEATAIGNMVSHGSKAIKEVLIVSPNDDFCPPCGGCRQKIQEFAGPDTTIHLVNQDGQIQSFTMAELLPLAFALEKN